MQAESFLDGHLDCLTSLFLEVIAETTIDRAQTNAETKVTLDTMPLCASFPEGTRHMTAVAGPAFTSVSVHKHGSD